MTEIEAALECVVTHRKGFKHSTAEDIIKSVGAFFGFDNDTQAIFRDQALFILDSKETGASK